MSNWKDKFPKENRYFETDNGILYCANVLEILSKFPAESIDCIITSPPYWGLRDYGKQARTIWNGDEICKHEWESIVLPNPGGIPKKKCGVGNWDRQIENPEFAVKGKPWESFFCKKCGAWYGQLGLEPTLDLYIKHLFEIMKKLKRILKETGVIFWNHNDCYGSHSIGKGNIGGIEGKRKKENSKYANSIKAQSLNKLVSVKDKCMALQNYRFILKCVDELGLILRNIIIWYKPNHMPSSVKDRFTNAYEPVFMLVKNKKYWFDLDAVRVPHKTPFEKLPQKFGRLDPNKKGAQNAMSGIIKYQAFGHPLSKNPGDLWEIPTQPFLEAHFATFPEKLVEPMIKCACPQWICKKCGFIRERVYEKLEIIGKEKPASSKFVNSFINSPGGRRHYISIQRKYKPDQKEIARFIKKHIDSEKKKELDKEFGRTTWEHWVRTDDTGACLPSPEQYLKLKEILKLPNTYDEVMLTTVKVIVDDKGNKNVTIGWTDCGCNAGWESGIVLDPFMGSGTVAVVAERLNRRWIGIEINPEYCEIAKRRILKETRQLKFNFK